MRALRIVSVVGALGLGLYAVAVVGTFLLAHGADLRLAEFGDHDG